MVRASGKSSAAGERRAEQRRLAQAGMPRPAASASASISAMKQPPKTAPFARPSPRVRERRAPRRAPPVDRVEQRAGDEMGLRPEPRLRERRRRDGDEPPRDAADRERAGLAPASAISGVAAANTRAGEQQRVERGGRA